MRFPHRRQIRPGRQRTFPKTAEAEVKALACELPAESEVPLARWSYTEPAAEAVSRGVVASISPSTVGRWLRADAIRPRRVRSWIFPRDPDFAAKAGPVLDLYDHLGEGQPLGENEYVISADDLLRPPAIGIPAERISTTRVERYAPVPAAPPGGRWN